MQYQGSKNRLAKQLLSAIPRNGEAWVEPMVGGCGMMRHVTGQRIGADNNKYIISFWKAIQSGWEPPTTLTREEYDHIKLNIDQYDPALVAFAGIGCSFGAKWFGGYAKANDKDYVAISHRSCLKVRRAIEGVEFVYSSYKDLEIPANSIIYADPPYADTSGYKEQFNHDEFWDWCRQKFRQGHQIYISEYKAPDDFKPILEIQRMSVMNSSAAKSGTKFTEKLFIYNPERINEPTNRDK